MIVLSRVASAAGAGSGLYPQGEYCLVPVGDQDGGRRIGPAAEVCRTVRAVHVPL